MSVGNTNPAPGAAGNAGNSDAGNSGGQTVESLTAALKAKEEELTSLNSKFSEQGFKIRTVESELEKFRKDQAARDQENAAKTGDVEKLRTSFAEEKTGLEKQLSDAQSQLRSVTVERDVRAAAMAAGAHSHEQVWRLIGGEFETHTEDGKVKVRVKDSVKSVEQRVREYLEQNPNLAKNPRVGGSGANGQGTADGTSSAMTVAEMNRNPEAAAAALRKDPKLAAEVLRGLGPKR